MQVIPLSEGSFTIDKSKLFIPFDPANDDFQKRTPGSLLVEIQPFVIISSKDILILDTGLGFTDADGMMQIHKNLLRNGIQPSEVTKVLISHLHKDHAGGISFDKGNSSSLSFPNANYYINKNEFESAINKDSPSYKIDDFKILIQNEQLHLIHDNGVIDNYIKYLVTGGHSPYHQVFWIVENGEKIFFGGDVAPQLQQMKSRFVAKYDFDGKKSMELRQKWWKQGAEEKWTFLFYHDINAPIYKPIAA